MAYKRKTVDTWELHVNYGGGWEHELTEYSRVEARRRVAEYLENCPQYPVKIIKRREKITGIFTKIVDAEQRMERGEL